MKKKWASFVLAVVLTLTIAIPASAATTTATMKAIAKAAANTVFPSISSSSLNLVNGDSAQLTVSLQGNDVTYGVLWSTNSPTVATVSHGTVTAVGQGIATITATTGDGRNASCVVRVGVKGIDVSYQQGTVNWTTVKNSGITFALLRTGYGNESPETQTDTTFVTNYSGATAAGVKVGVYHYSYAQTTSEAVEEAQFCLNILDGRSLDYPVYIDLEDDSQSSLTSDQLSAIAAAFCKTITDAGYQAGVYSTSAIMNSKLTSSVLDSYDKWIAHIDTAQPNYSGDYTVWQYSHTGTVSGISGSVDLDYSYRDYPNALPATVDISLISDTSSAITLQKGKSYTFKFTPNGLNSVPIFSSGNSAAVKVTSQRAEGECYYVTVTAVGSGSTSLYSSVSGSSAVRRCVITVS